jgi:hypothetical protein
MLAEMQQNIHRTWFQLPAKHTKTERVGGRIDTPLTKTEAFTVHTNLLRP